MCNCGSIEEMEDTIEQLKEQRDELLEACKTFAEWLRREDEGFSKLVRAEIRQKARKNGENGLMRIFAFAICPRV